jgi:N-acetylmuramoyl-L-alanine amidase
MLYRVQTGAFTVCKNAEALKKELQEKDIDAFITVADLGKLFYRVQVGAFSVRKNAVNMQKVLRKAGYDAVIVRA